MKKEVLRMENILTDYPDGNNLKNLYFQVYEGEIMGVVGINKYGLEHFLELICNNTPIKFGRVYFQEVMVNHYGHIKDTANRVSIIGRNDSLLYNLSVADNIFVLRKGGKSFFVNKKALRQEVRYYMKHFQIDINPGKKVKYLEGYEKCTVELLKAYILGAKLVIYDGTGSRLGDLGDYRIREVLRRMTKEGMAAVFVGNHYEELISFCDRLALFKDGKIIKVFPKQEMDVRIMEACTPLLESGKNGSFGSGFKRNIIVDDWNTQELKHFSLSLEAGECVMLYDKSNKIQSGIMRRLCGEGNETGGSIVFKENGREKVISGRFLHRDIAVIEENPLETMLFYQYSYLDNLCFLLEKKMNTIKITSKIKKSIEKEYMEILGKEVKSRNILELDKVSLYNLVYYRIHLLNPKLVFIVQPFSKTDLRTRYYIVSLIRVLKEAGIAVIILTSSIADAERVVDRLCVVENGSKKKEYKAGEFEKARMEN